MVAFDAGGNMRWIVPNETPQIATADGGVIGQSGIIYDQSGNATGMISGATQSWRGNEYQGQGLCNPMGMPVPEDEASFWSTAGATRRGTGPRSCNAPACCIIGGLRIVRRPPEVAAAAAVPQQQPPPGPPAYVLLVGDPGLNTVDCATNILHCHNLGTLLVSPPKPRQILNAQGNLAYPRKGCRRSRISAQLDPERPHNGGVVYFGHGGAIEWRPGSGTLFPGERAGPDTNVSALNVQTLSNTELGPHATVTLNACDAAKGGRNSIAQLIANRLQRRVYAPLLGMYFSTDPNTQAPNGRICQTCQPTRRCT